MEYYISNLDLDEDDASYISFAPIPKSFLLHVYPNAVWHIILDQDLGQRYSKHSLVRKMDYTPIVIMLAAAFFDN